MLLSHLKITFGLNALKAIAHTPFGKLSSRVKALSTDDVQHQAIHPLATYAPWLSDNDFMTTFEAVRRNTLVDIYRCFGLWSMLAQAAKSGDGDILEVGVWRGGTGAILAKRAKLLGLQSKVYLADTFTGVVKTGSRDAGYADGEHADTSIPTVRGLLGSLQLKAEILQGIFPDQRPREIDQNKFIFCHIDVDTYESASAVFEWVWPRLNQGGIVVFDDYGFFRCAGVTRLCEELKSRHGLTHIYNLSGHGVFVKVS